jgi:hypothetical protein
MVTDHDNGLDAFGDKLPIVAYCSHSHTNEDFEEIYAACPDCFQDIY